jgi:predicted enzyme related to lactoylglutathione lyase
MITEIAFFVYPVSDMARARRFYEGVLNLKLESNFGEEWIEYGIGGGTFAITTMDLEHRPGVPGGVIALEVLNLEMTLNRFKEQSVPFVREVFATPVCRMAIVADPDGNHIIIHKRNV